MSEANAGQDFLGLVRQAWREKRVSVTALAKRVGVSRQQAHRVLSGESDPPYSSARAYYDAWMEMAQEVANRG